MAVKLSKLCDLGLEQGETPHRETEVAIVVVGRVEVTGVEVEVVRVVTIRVGSRGPIVTVVACVVQPTGVHVPGPEETDLRV